MNPRLLSLVSFVGFVVSLCPFFFPALCFPSCVLALLPCLVFLSTPVSHLFHYPGPVTYRSSPVRSPSTPALHLSLISFSLCRAFFRLFSSPVIRRPTPPAPRPLFGLVCIKVQSLVQFLVLFCCFSASPGFISPSCSVFLFRPSFLICPFAFSFGTFLWLSFV